MSKIHVLTKRVGCIPRSVWIENSLSALQKNVDGYIEAVTIATDMVILCNEEGRLRELPYNCTVCGVDFVGDLVFVGRDGDEFCDLPCDYQTMKLLFPQLWEV